MDQTEQKPSVGRIVHYAIPGLDEHAAAIITHVYEDGLVNLAVYERFPAGSTKPERRGWLAGASPMAGDNGELERRHA